MFRSGYFTCGGPRVSLPHYAEKLLGGPQGMALWEVLLIPYTHAFDTHRNHVSITGMASKINHQTP
jgi:hypothetical protein